MYQVEHFIDEKPDKYENLIFFYQ